MWKKYERACAKINLDAIDFNVESMHRNLKPGVQMIAVIKTDAYGHGSVPIANLLEPKDSFWGFAVATADEAMVLRKAGIKKPILVLGTVFPSQWEEALLNDIRMTAYTKEFIKAISKLAVKHNKKAYLHVKLDTGMSRLGFPICEDTINWIADLHSLEGIVYEGLFTHFAKADETDKAFTQKQIDDYMFIKKGLDQKGVIFKYYHCSNSAAIIDLPEANMNLVRAGISTYGLYPSGEVRKQDVALKPALELTSHIAMVKWVEKGTPVSYGSTYITDRRTRIATIPIGYGDGYPRSLSNQGYLLIHGQKAPILGRICMDQLMVDVTDIEEAKHGDLVTLIGENEGAYLPVEALSDLSGRFNYEFVCDINKRVPREYWKNGEIVEQIDYFHRFD